MKTIIYLIFAFCLFINAYGQEKSYTLEAPDTQSKEYIARDFVLFKPGYTFTAEAGKSMSARIEQTLIFPPTRDTYLKPDGTTTSDPTQGGVAVGSIAGALDVSPSGAATYTVPIEVPAGINGMQPNLSLVYNSQSGAGIAGMCWNLSGLSMISRVPKTHYYDGERTIYFHIKVE